VFLAGIVYILANIRRPPLGSSLWTLAIGLSFGAMVTALDLLARRDPSTLFQTLGMTFEIMIPVMFFFYGRVRGHEQSQRRVAVSEQSYRLIVEHAGEAIVRFGLRGEVLFANEAGWRMVDRKKAPEEPLSLLRFIHPEDRRRALKLAVRAIRRREPVDFEVRVVGRGENIRTIAATLIPIIRAGKVIHLQGIGRDITAERRALSQIRFLASVITESSAPILLLNPEGKVTVWNRGAEELTGVPPARAVGHPYSELFPYVSDLFLEVAAGEGAFSVETELPTSEGMVPVLLTAYRVGMGEASQGIAVFLQDLRRLRTLEEQLQHQQRMEALGKLAGGIAHDFNNLLTIISGNASILAEHLEKDSALSRYAQGILRAAKRGAGMTSQLLTFSRKRPYTPRRVSLDVMVEETVDLLKHAGWRDVRFEVELATNVPDAWADASRLQQVLMNLCVNAKEAMPRGGRITIRLKRRRYHTAAALPHDAVTGPGDYLVLEVKDTGVGMDPTVISRIFEPFYTTKSESKGTGLGLANVHGIVHQHHGWIEVDSSPGRGTTFRVLLPGCELAQSFVNASGVERGAAFPPGVESPAAEPHPEKEGAPGHGGAQAPHLRGRETILLVDAEEPVREIGGSVLEMYGYKVLQAGDANETLSLLKRAGNPADLIVMDWDLPGTDGVSFVRQVRKFAPGTPILLLSGLLTSAQVETPGLYGVQGFLAKPFLPEALVAEVRSLLDSRARRNTSS
ncbi:MAG TPA: response regulator, partial [Bacteroidetes bacterium]|nr:response regulator [Bacteroidota bacterium]